MIRRTERKLLGILFTMAIVLGLMAGMTVTASAATPTLWVGGVGVTDEVTSGTGWSYNAATKTLTLDGYSYSGTGYSYVDEWGNYSYSIYAVQDLTIDLKGTNSIENTNTDSGFNVAVYVEGTLSITGNGSLTAANSGGVSSFGIMCVDMTVERATVNATGADGIYCANDITIESGTVNATGNGEDGHGIYAENDVKINNGVVTATGADTENYSTGIYGKNSVTISNGTVNATSAGNTMGSGIMSKNDVTISGGNVTATAPDDGIRSDAGSVTIYGGTVNASGNRASGIMGPTGVTINGGTVTATGSSSGIWSVVDVTINGGTVTATGTGEESYGIHAGNDVKINNGTVTATSGEEGAGILGGRVTIENGNVTASGEKGIATNGEEGNGITISGGSVIASGDTQGLVAAEGTLTIDDQMSVKAGDDKASAVSISDRTTWEHKEKWVSVGHIHDFTYTASGATITAACSEDGCTLPEVDNEPTATLTVSAPATDGGAAVLEVVPEGVFGDLSGKVRYQTKNGSTWGEETTTAPTEAGIHRASVTLDGKTALVAYGVNCITYATNLTNGSISGAAGATCGATVTPTVTPAAGYQLDTLTVTPAAGSGVSAVTVDGGTFVMPEANVTVSATFKQITYTVTVAGAKATVKDSLPTPNTWTAELTGLPADKTYDGETVTLTASVQKSDGFPADKVTVGEVSFKDQNDNAVTTAKNVGTYTAYATVGDQTISKSFTIRGQDTPVSYLKITGRGDDLDVKLVETTQYIILKDNPNGITWLYDGQVYVCNGPVTVGALVIIGDLAMVMNQDGALKVRAGTYHFGSSLEIYDAVGADNTTFTVEGTAALSSLNDTSGRDLQQIKGTDAAISGTIRVYGKNFTVEKGNNDKLFADDICLILGTEITAKGLKAGSELSYLTGGKKAKNGLVTYDKESLSELVKLLTEVKPAATVTTAPVAQELTYNGQAQKLVTAGAATGGTMQYALGAEIGTTGDYSTAIPTATDAGTYYVWYKVVGDDNHNDTDPTCIKVTISAPASAPDPKPAEEEVVVPVSGDDESEQTVPVSASITTDESGTTGAKVAEVTTEAINEVAEEGGSVTIDLTAVKTKSGEDTNVTSVTVSAKTVESVIESKAGSLEIKLDSATAVIDGTTLETLAEAAKDSGGDTVTLVIDKDEKAEASLSEEQKAVVEKIDNAVVLDAYFISGGKRISDFQGGTVQLTASFESEKPVTVLYIDSKGNVKKIASTYDAEKKVTTFKVNHFSNYVITETKANTLTVKAKKKAAAVKFSKLKKKARTIKLSRLLKVSKAIGTVTYSRVSAKKGGKSYSKYFTVNSKTGKITVKKGLKKGTYTIAIKVKAAGKNEYAAAEKTVRVKIKVK